VVLTFSLFCIQIQGFYPVFLFYVQFPARTTDIVQSGGRRKPRFFLALHPNFEILVPQLEARKKAKCVVDFMKLANPVITGRLNILF
jgi:hypothetical protein